MGMFRAPYVNTESGKYDEMQTQIWIIYIGLLDRLY